MGQSEKQDLSGYIRGEGRAWCERYRGPAYIAGPMADRPGHGYLAFHEAAAVLRSYGVVVFSPAEGAPDIQSVIEATVAYGDFRASPLYAIMMRRDFGLILQSQALFLLPGWQDSRGASAEALVGALTGCTLFDGAWLVS